MKVVADVRASFFCAVIPAAFPMLLLSVHQFAQISGLVMLACLVVMAKSLGTIAFRCPYPS